MQKNERKRFLHVTREDEDTGDDSDDNDQLIRSGTAPFIPLRVKSTQGAQRVDAVYLMERATFFTMTGSSGMKYAKVPLKTLFSCLQDSFMIPETPPRMQHINTPVTTVTDVDRHGSAVAESVTRDIVTMTADFKNDSWVGSRKAILFEIVENLGHFTAHINQRDYLVTQPFYSGGHLDFACFELPSQSATPRALSMRLLTNSFQLDAFFALGFEGQFSHPFHPTVKMALGDAIEVKPDIELAKVLQQLYVSLSCGTFERDGFIDTSAAADIWTPETMCAMVESKWRGLPLTLSAAPMWTSFQPAMSYTELIASQFCTQQANSPDTFQLTPEPFD